MKSSIFQYSGRGFAQIFPKFADGLSTLCKDDETCERKLPEMFRYKCVQKYYCLVQFFFFFWGGGMENPMESWESCRHSKRHTNCFCSAERSFSVLRRP